MSVFDNKRYKDLVVRPGEWIPDIGMEYPEDDHLARLVPSEKVRSVKFDDSYPFYENGFFFNLQRIIVQYLVCYGPVYFINKFRYGMKVKGRDILKKYRRQFAGGIVTVSNHCYFYDEAAISVALRHTLWTPMLSDHFEGKNWWVLKHFGGIPLSDGSLSATKKFNESFDIHHSKGDWVHVFPEARSWFFYKPLRPWMKGAFSMAYRWNAPILPIAITFRERKGFYKWTGKVQEPLVTINIGEPIFPDATQPRKAEVSRLQNEAFDAVCALAGIQHNTWPCEWNES